MHKGLLFVLSFSAVSGCSSTDHQIQRAVFDSSATAVPADTAPKPVTPPSIAITDRAPAWYVGQKPWSEIGQEGREQMLQMRAAYEADQATAHQPGSGLENDLATEGRRLIDRTVQKYGLSSHYREPDTFGARMVIWLPETAWNNLTLTQKKAIEAYMSSKYTNWGVGIGRVRGTDVLYDDIVVEH